MGKFVHCCQTMTDLEAPEVAESAVAAAPTAADNNSKRPTHPVAQTQVRAVCQGLGYSMGSGVYEELIHFINKNFAHFDSNRGIKWEGAKLEMVRAWFDVHMRGKPRERRERMREYVKNLVVTCIVGAARYAEYQRRKTIKRSDMKLLLEFLYDVY